MPPTTWTALLLLVVAVLPGAMFTFAFERQAGAFGVTLADRVLRFVAASVVFNALYAWPGYLAHRATCCDAGLDMTEFVVGWASAVVGLTLPALLGRIVGGLYVTQSDRRGWDWVRRRLSAEREARR